MHVIVRERWRSAVLFAVLLHAFVLGIAGLLLPDAEEMPGGVQELAWLDVSDAEETAERVPAPVQETPQPPADEAAQEETLLPEPLPPPPLPREGAKEVAKAPREGEKKTAQEERKKPMQKRDYPEMRKPNKPAVLREETKRSLTEKETAYRGHVRFFADVSREGRVTGVQAWQFEPEIADEKERRLLEEQLEKRIKESWRYAPSLTPEGVPTTQTKAEELDIPERKQPKDVRQDVPGLR